MTLSRYTGARLLAMLTLLAALAPAHPAGAWELWNEEECHICRTGVGATDFLGVAYLARVTDDVSKYTVGCYSDLRPSYCNLQDMAAGFQAGGHANSFVTLHNGMIGKLSYLTGSEGLENADRLFGQAQTEYRFNMWLWCLRKMRDVGDPAWAEHPLAGLIDHVPQFYGICALEDDSQASYIVQENLFKDYKEVSQLDVKLGFYTVEPGSWQDSGLKKFVKKAIADKFTESSTSGVRFVASSLWDPERQARIARKNKRKNGFKKMKSILSNLHSGRQPIELWRQLSASIAPLIDWQIKHGDEKFRIVASSLLLYWEGAPESNDLKPGAKWIDFAHAFAVEEHPDWPRDGDLEGLVFIKRSLDDLIRKVERSTSSVDRDEDAGDIDGRVIDLLFKMTEDEGDTDQNLEQLQDR